MICSNTGVALLYHVCKQRSAFKVLCAFLVFFSLSGCADNISIIQAAEIETVGFWHGFWHGAIFPMALIGMIFSDNVTFYAFNYSGGGYKFGYFLGIFMFGPIFHITLLSGLYVYIRMGVDKRSR